MGEVLKCNYKGNLIIINLPEGERIGSCSLNKEQQDNLKTYIENQFAKINEENGGVLILPPKTKFSLIELKDKTNE